VRQAPQHRDDPRSLARLTSSPNTTSVMMSLKRVCSPHTPASPFAKIAQIHFTAHGTVQGVFFRVHCVKAAEQNKLTGWVRNLPSGTAVEGEAQGAEEGLKEFLKAVDKGPPGSHVVRLDHHEVPLKEGEQGFRKVKSYEQPPV
jgi:acylphosphatase